MVKMTVSEGEESGKLIVEAVGVNKSFGGPPIIKDFSIRIATWRPDRSLSGPTAPARPTLLNLLTGMLAPDSGKLKLGAALQMVTLDQRRESLDPQTTLSDTLTGGGSDYCRGRRRAQACDRLHARLPVRARAGAHAVSALSGGERGRLMLARALANPPTCSCWTSRPTISTSRLSTCCRR